VWAGGTDTGYREPGPRTSRWGSAGELVGTVLLDVAKEYWIVEPADSSDGWLIHVNEPDARETAIRGLIGSAY
jgi:hypothetical protein